MFAVEVTSSLFPVSSPQSYSVSKTPGKLGNKSGSVHMRGYKTKPVNSGGTQATTVNQSRMINGLKTDDYPTSHARVFRQNFSIRSYEIGANGTASIETLMNYLQETALNHAKSVGLLGDGFSTPEMSKRNLIWLVTKMRVIVDRYPTWGDIVHVSTWVAQNGKNGMRRDWLLRDSKTGDILTRASSSWIMMNTETRRFSKIPYEVRDEIERCFVDIPPIFVDDDCGKLPKLEEATADYVLNNLTPQWSDLDFNQHVNNVKYIGWILESVPQVVEKYELGSITLEYRRECRKDSLVKSLTSVLGDKGGNGGTADPNHFDCQHVLLFDDGSAIGAPSGEILKAKTEWRPKHMNKNRNIDH